MTKGPDVDEIIKRMALANHDGDIKAIAVIIINADNQPEIEMSFGGNHAFTMNMGCDLLKHNIIVKLLSDGQIPPKERE